MRILFATFEIYLLQPRNPMLPFTRLPHADAIILIAAW
jgi:hypothetical protein